MSQPMNQALDSEANVDRNAGPGAMTRYVYWMAPGRFDDLRSSLANRRRRITPVKSVPCKAMNPVVDLAYVAPEEWDRVCSRQGSWYRESGKAGKTMVVSTEPLEGFEDELSAVILPSDFEPPSEVDEEEAREMVREPAYLDAEPKGWRQLTSRETAYWRNLLARVGANADIRQLLDLHSANHANFIEPRFYVEEGGEVTPYSIARTARVCSACVELFNVLGEQFERKYVTPCPGYVLFGKGRKDGFLKVLSGEAARRYVAASGSAAAASGAEDRTE